MQMIHWYHNFLNFVVIQEEIKMQEAKIDDIRTWSTWKIVHEIIQFLKFVNFYKRFIKHFNKIATFLTKMLKKSTKFRKHEIVTSMHWVEVISRAWQMIFRVQPQGWHVCVNRWLASGLQAHISPAALRTSCYCTLLSSSSYVVSSINITA